MDKANASYYFSSQISTQKRLQYMYRVYVDGNPGTGFKQTGTKMWQSLTNERYSNPHPPLYNWISKGNADVKERKKAALI